ncbi:MAG: response regulator [Leptolyngbyaceae cyanobacterium]
MSALTPRSARTRKPPKTRMLVVDDEPENLDLLYRTFRRDFMVLRAESGQEALNILSEQGEVAVIISDQRMPEMKGTEFLSKTVPEFPDTVRIILTGFTDVEDLVDAINAGQVYRYITKPWDPEALKQVVQRAADTYEILKQRGDAIQQVQTQQAIVLSLADIAQKGEPQAATLTATAEALNEILNTGGCVVATVAEGQLGDGVGIGGKGEATVLKENPLVATAIAQHTPQTLPDASTAENADAYQGAGIQAHAVIPVLFRDEVVAIISCQWPKTQVFSEAQLNLFTIAARQVGLTLACCG